MPLTLCVLLWARPGMDDALTAYEDEVLKLVAVHGGTVLSRVHRLADSGAGEPLEVQVIQMPNEAALNAYMNDPARLAMTATRDAAIARTDIIPVKQLT